MAKACGRFSFEKYKKQRILIKKEKKRKKNVNSWNYIIIYLLLLKELKSVKKKNP